MTNEQIFEIANQHLRYFEDGWRGTEWSGKPEELLKFARAIEELAQDPTNPPVDAL
jgi:hypothetical protein